MAHLNIEDIDEFEHLIQLFLYAHPEYCERHEHVRQASGLSGAYLLSQDMTQALVQWAWSKHFLTRRQGERLLAGMRQFMATPDEVVRLLPCMMGTPPTQQVGVLGSDVFAWIRCGAAEEPHKEYVFTLETAVRVCVQIADDPEIPAYHAARARTLAGWLEAQRAA